jgi:hypothetical protein
MMLSDNMLAYFFLLENFTHLIKMRLSDDYCKGQFCGACHEEPVHVQHDKVKYLYKVNM